MVKCYHLRSLTKVIFCVSMIFIRCYIYSIILRGKFVFLDFGVQNVTEFSNIDSSGICLAPMLHCFQMSHFIDYFSSFFHNFSFFIRKKKSERVIETNEHFWDKKVNEKQRSEVLHFNFCTAEQQRLWHSTQFFSSQQSLLMCILWMNDSKVNWESMEQCEESIYHIPVLQLQKKFNILNYSWWYP